MNKEIEKLNKQIEKLEKKVSVHQSSCDHKNCKIKYGSNTGNYDPSADCYWITADCLDCGKYMNFDSDRDKENYRKYSLLSRK